MKFRWLGCKLGVGKVWLRRVRNVRGGCPRLKCPGAKQTVWCGKILGKELSREMFAGNCPEGLDWIEQGLTSHSTHFRSFQRRWGDCGISQDCSRSQSPQCVQYWIVCARPLLITVVCMCIIWKALCPYSLDAWLGLWVSLEHAFTCVSTTNQAVRCSSATHLLDNWEGHVHGEIWVVFWYDGLRIKIEHQVPPCSKIKKLMTWASCWTDSSTFLKCRSMM